MIDCEDFGVLRLSQLAINMNILKQQYGIQLIEAQTFIILMGLLATFYLMH